ncbi:probable malonyl-CoA-acyl carrier protein transacylase, mitochondrial [Rhopalosiphum maidis]|uniref:probable malonyl-CoA-acyl carrier protein transacylase, mitochondrial n=1 Tax=Rhopalosiphum maidis TaxID=43146 RepID=UPI000EFF4047|nr:probable malonyl-CoA-acyl carrier protein transacylase, mitochondrial [Rhopalosiphum maidis]
MVSIGKCHQWYYFFKKTSTKRLINTLYSASSESNYLNHRTQLRCMSIDNSSKNTNETDIKKLLEDGTVPEESSVVGDTENWTTSPYPKGSYVPHKNQSQAQHALRPNVDPKETSILLFPGQGTQFVGMGKNLLVFPQVVEMFEAASEILKYNLLKLCLEGPKSKLDQTIYSQPAIFVCSLGAIEKLKEEQLSAIENCMAVAGYSIGEFAALTFAGCFSFEQAVNLVKVRAEAMHYASEIEPGGMANIHIRPDSKLKYAMKMAKDWCLDKGIENPICSISNYLNPDCKVVAGHLEALKYLESNLKQYNLRKMQRLNVSGAFHTDLMRPAVEPFAAALHNIKIAEPLIAVHSNIDGKRYQNSAQIYRNLPKQIYKPVKWEQTLHILYERPIGSNFPDTYECGPGSTLRNLLKTVNSKAHCSCQTIDI